MGEDAAVALVDHDGGARDGGQVGELVLQLAGRQRRHQVLQALALDRGDRDIVHQHGVVAGGQRLAPYDGLLLAERPGVALLGVDHDLQPCDPLRPGVGDVDPRPRLLRRTRRLPEDHLPPTPDGGGDELRPVLPTAVEHEVDRGAAPDAGAHRHPLDHLRILRPPLEAVAVDLRRPRPGLPRLQQDPVAERDPQDVGKRRPLLRVARDDEVVGHGGSLPVRRPRRPDDVLGHC